MSRLGAWDRVRHLAVVSLVAVGLSVPLASPPDYAADKKAPACQVVLASCDPDCLAAGSAPSTSAPAASAAPCPKAGAAAGSAGSTTTGRPRLLSLTQRIVQRIADSAATGGSSAEESRQLIEDLLLLGEQLLDTYGRLGWLPLIATWLLTAYLTRRSWGRLFYYAWLDGRRLPTKVKVEPLESQRGVVDSIAKMVDRMEDGNRGVLLGLKGEWGVGKSHVLSALESALQGRSDVAVVSINVWEHQRELDLHFALVKAVLTHPKVFERCIDAYPVHLLFVPLLMAMIRLLPKGWSLNFEVSRLSLSATIPVAIPLPWQGGFRRVMEKANHEKLKVVIVLDEIDRTEPEAAQAVVTLARRALDLPGILTILPYVEAQLRYKVFNPFAVVSPDLAATMFAVLEEAYPGRVPAIEPGDLPRNVAERYRQKLLLAYASPPGLPDTASEFDIERERYRLYRVFSEKYLAAMVELHPLSPADLVPLLARSAVAAGVWESSGAKAMNNDLAKSMAKEVDSAEDLRRNRRPTHRAFEGEALHLLSEFALRAEVAARSQGGTGSKVHQVKLQTVLSVAYLLAGNRQLANNQE